MLSMREIERALRHFRDYVLIKPLAQSRRVRKFAFQSLEIAVLDCGDHSLAFDPNDGVISQTIHKHNGWFRDETLRVMQEIPKKGGIFVDVGANIGTQTIYALIHGGFERAVCFEPSPKSARILRINALINGLQDRVHIIEKAVGSFEGHAKLFLDNKNHGGHSLLRDHGSNSITVPITTGEKALADIGIGPEQVGLAWIDVEGFEGDVLAGWPSLRGTPICVEYTPEYRVLPNSTFDGWTTWSVVDKNPLSWRPISELNMSSFQKQLDMVFY